jgi:hypothetical protein
LENALHVHSAITATKKGRGEKRGRNLEGRKNQSKRESLREKN